MGRGEKNKKFIRRLRWWSSQITPLNVFLPRSTGLVLVWSCSCHLLSNLEIRLSKSIVNYVSLYLLATGAAQERWTEELEVPSSKCARISLNVVIIYTKKVKIYRFCDPLGENLRLACRKCFPHELIKFRYELLMKRLESIESTRLSLVKL